MTELGIGTTPAPGLQRFDATATGTLRCPHCDVTWRGRGSSTCWCCGRAGSPAYEARLVDET